MAEVKLKQKIISAFKMHGLSLRSEASRFLVEILTPVNEVEREDWLDRMIEAVQKQPLTSSAIDRPTMETVIGECSADEQQEMGKIFNVIGAFSVPRFIYNAERKKFLSDTVVSRTYTDAKAKNDLFTERYNLLYQRTVRHDLFTPNAAAEHLREVDKKFELKPIEYLLGSTFKLGEIIVLGMITQLKEGKYHLEDCTGTVELDLSNTNFHAGLFTEACFVLAEGWYEDRVFHVNALGFPPPESSETTRAYFGNVNFFGGPSEVNNARSSDHLKAVEAANEDAMFVFLSDVWLDHHLVKQKLQALFEGFSECPPFCFVFSGNFTSTPYGYNRAKILQESMKNLADILLNYPSLVENSQFVFVPGLKDPGSAEMFPRPPLPECITRELQQKIPQAIFTTNPCRIRYCTQEMVVFREDIVTKLCRNCIKFPQDKTEIPTHFVKTLVGQAHLVPLPLHVSPAYWSFDHALHLYPVPDLLVVGDKYQPFVAKTLNCLCTNTGSFLKSDFSFKVYYPASRQLEDSKIGDERM